MFLPRRPTLWGPPPPLKAMFFFVLVKAFLKTILDDDAFEQQQRNVGGGGGGPPVGDNIGVVVHAWWWCRIIIIIAVVESQRRKAKVPPPHSPSLSRLYTERFLSSSFCSEHHKTNAKNAKASNKCFFVQRGFLLWRRRVLCVCLFFLSFFVSFFVTSKQSSGGKRRRRRRPKRMEFTNNTLDVSRAGATFRKKEHFCFVWSKWHSKKKDYKNAWHEIRAQKKSSIALARSRNVKVVV